MLSEETHEEAGFREKPNNCELCDSVAVRGNGSARVVFCSCNWLPRLWLLNTHSHQPHAQFPQIQIQNPKIQTIQIQINCLAAASSTLTPTNHMLNFPTESRMLNLGSWTTNPIYGAIGPILRQKSIYPICSNLGDQIAERWQCVGNSD